MNNQEKETYTYHEKCPNCNNFVPVSINQILFSDYLFCPTCGLKIAINEQKGVQTPFF